VNRHDRKRWASAQTLAGLGELTALWLEGGIGEHPCYAGGPDPETAALVPVLARLNRSGLITIASQPGRDGTGPGGARWRQRAAVECFAAGTAAARALGGLAARAGAACIAHSPDSLPRWHYRTSREAVVTLRGGEDYTWFGMQLSRRDIRSSRAGWGICGRPVTGALCRAWQVTLVDMEWGRDDVLWPALERFARLGAQ
jgi:hypothetical protein